ncbi:MAG TPA: chemotaxis protein CheW [Alphaproteobacteria bacterium]|nr:chemotaxis protein CheW [Alphaproteobacteria bacterium]
MSGVPALRASDPALPAAEAAAAQYVAVAIGGEEYGLPILRVREIRGWTPETPLPGVPPHVRGVVNLRGLIVPVFDLRRRFGAGATAPTPRHVVVVVQLGRRLHGLLVDGISDIVAVPEGAAQPPPAFDGLIESQFIEGLVQERERMIALLDVERLLSGEAASETP